MFKKIVLISVALFFGVGILMTSVLRTSAQTVNDGLEAEAVEFVVTEAEEPTPAAETAVEYNLTWPGILPDHFLYPIKMIRDRIWLFLTTDNYKKAELMLKYADKRVWSASMLVDREKYDLAASTATKAEKYLQQAIEQEKIAREKGEDTKALLETLSQAALKHEEMLVIMKDQVPDSTKAVIESALSYPRDGYEEVMGRLKED